MFGLMAFRDELKNVAAEEFKDGHISQDDVASVDRICRRPIKLRLLRRYVIETGVSMGALPALAMSNPEEIDIDKLKELIQFIFDLIMQLIALFGI